MTHANVLITGGAGFIGCNLAHRLLQRGQDITIYDNLSRPGTEMNLAWLRQRHGETFRFVRGDLQEYSRLFDATRDAEIIIPSGRASCGDDISG
jgi:CDP-paratose 2-epimerase